MNSGSESPTEDYSPSLEASETPLEPVRLSDVDYELPEAAIAQHPVEPRDSARLLCVPRHGGELRHLHFYDLPTLLNPTDILVVNETRVTAVRLMGKRSGGGAVEALLLRPAAEYGADTWEALVRPGKRIHTDDILGFDEAGLTATVGATTESGGRILKFNLMEAVETTDGITVDTTLQTRGTVPLPPYITAPLNDRERYQTVYARTPGSAAAPTAGLHFTPELIAKIEAMGISIVRVRLDVGLGTFRPIRGDDVSQHEMHSEAFAVDAAAADAINSCRGRVIAVGTTSLRALETAATVAGTGERVGVIAGETRLFVRPGYRFRAVDALITNFHQPHSTLLLLVAAFIGREPMRNAYTTALAEGYRFLSFGDAMFAF